MANGSSSIPHFVYFFLLPSLSLTHTRTHTHTLSLFVISFGNGTNKKFRLESSESKHRFFLGFIEKQKGLGVREVITIGILLCGAMTVISN